MKIIQALNYDEKEKLFKEFYVNSCGIISEIDADTGVKRINGRADYQLIFVKKGPFYVKYSDEWNTVTSDKIILFKPGEVQEYKCIKDEGAEYLWIHFDGCFAKQILKGSNIYDNNCLDSKISVRCEKIIKTMISEITRKSKEYEFKVMGLFCELIGEIIKGRYADNFSIYELLRPALNDMEQEPESNKTVLEYANMCNLSEFYFIHKFKEIIGKSPMQYKNEILMKQAAYLAENTNLSISEISEAVGIEDSMYFSKKFKAIYGVSPTEFRKKL